MTPHLIDALARLAPLGRDELAVVGATATALMAQAAPGPAATPAMPAPARPGAIPPRRRVPTRPASGAGAFDPPPIGGTALSPQPSPLFTRAPFATRWRPGRRVLVYLGANRGLAGLMRRLHHPGPPPCDVRRLCAFKVGTHEVGADLGGRLRRLSAERYGGVWRDGTTVVDDPTWGEWRIEPLNPGTADPAPGSPVRLGVDAIEVTLPATLTPAGFDQRLGTLLSPSTLAAFALSPAGRDLCAARGEDPVRFVRYSPRGAGRSRRATEITLIGRHDLGRLLRTIERLLLDHVLVDAAS